MEISHKLGYAFADDGQPKLFSNATPSTGPELEAGQLCSSSSLTNINVRSVGTHRKRVRNAASRLDPPLWTKFGCLDPDCTRDRDYKSMQLRQEPQHGRVPNGGADRGEDSSTVRAGAQAVEVFA